MIESSDRDRGATRRATSHISQLFFAPKGDVLLHAQLIDLGTRSSLTGDHWRMGGTSCDVDVDHLLECRIRFSIRKCWIIYAP